MTMTPAPQMIVPRQQDAPQHRLIAMTTTHVLPMHVIQQPVAPILPSLAMTIMHAPQMAAPLPRDAQPHRSPATTTMHAQLITVTR